MRNILVIIILALWLGAVPCGAKDSQKSPRRGSCDEFYESARLIMLKSERKIYKHLPDEEARESFIRDFWKKRDPNPETEENEAKQEFERRVSYVERWFRERVGGGRGWESDRGKIYLLLGPPDSKTTETGSYNRRRWNSRGSVKVMKDIWIYDRLRLYIEFADTGGLGVYRIRNWSPEVLSAIENVKFRVHPGGNRKQRFKFKAKFSDNKIKIIIPSKTVSFEDNGNGIMDAHFKITVSIYRDYKKIGNIEEDVDLQHRKEDLLSGKNIDFTVPYVPASKGAYLFDIIVEDTMTGSRYRDTVKLKF
ncbi:MAG: GWxTD domain-containing protein [bacterium]|nr:GWxTD domain-containing protein [bacterium]